MADVDLAALLDPSGTGRGIQIVRRTNDTTLLSSYYVVPVVTLAGRAGDDGGHRRAEGHGNSSGTGVSEIVHPLGWPSAELWDIAGEMVLEALERRRITDVLPDICDTHEESA